MLAMPDPATAFIDPFCSVPTLSLTCTIAETGTKEAYNRDPRGIAQRGEKYLQSTGMADAAVFGPEAEFFIFDNVQFDAKSNGTFYSVDSEEAIWNTGREEVPNLGYKIRHKEGYFPVAPNDTQQDIRTEMCLVMEQLGIKIERQHHEVATGGQAEIDFRFDTLVKTADNMMLYKYVDQKRRPEARQDGHLHAQAALWRQRFGHAHPPELVEEGQAAVCGQGIRGPEPDGAVLHRRHLEARQGAVRDCAVRRPTPTSGWCPGYEAPVNLAYSARNRSAAIRIPTFSESPKAKRIEYRPPDPSANPYLCYTALLMAGLDGVLNKIKPGRTDGQEHV